MTQSEEALLSRIKINRRGCWEWQGALAGSNDNYGVLIFNKKRWYTHRFSYTIFAGQIPKGLKVCHDCDNPKCANPLHLFLGTQKDNLHDCIVKGRRANYNPAVRTLTDEKAKEIKTFIQNNPNLSAMRVAEYFKISYMITYHMKKGNYYKNIL